LFVLGLDGGGSKTDAVVMRDDGAVVGWGRGGPTHTLFEPEAATRDSIPTAIAEAQARAGGVAIERVVLGFAGGDASGALERVGLADRWRCAGEIDTIVAAHQVCCGLVVLASTGSGVHVIQRDGRQMHLGGLGPVIGDEGSAYAIGVRAIRACALSKAGPRRATSLKERILHDTNLERTWDFVTYYNRRATRRDIAALARSVDEEAEAGDPVARAILEESARELGALAVDALVALGMLGEAYPMVPAGSVAMRSRTYWAAMIEHVTRYAPRVEPRCGGLDPVVGAALLALSDSGVAWTDELLARTRVTATASRGG
jgi:N-acetylmuramic acid 6-phosphate etherase